ncbi:hypothetical protein OYT1_ch1620 [Ferriphaselus amnicola]|uniref:Uncharacterized protein n=1 Tax=Ferriphaselus amnicola TaxID=1188319 RepID=A0A2Z6GCK0_9PROT|nr:hypothetical protein [Ferriphaselus amnicola]BBE51167.1 hypothetical protein OYT1_ch1620 [Ferriphaselus amnicola]
MNTNLKAYFVEMKITAVVMAEDRFSAVVEAESLTNEIMMTSDANIDRVVLVESLDQFATLDPDWDGECVPFGYYGNTRLKDLLPQEKCAQPSPRRPSCAVNGIPGSGMVCGRVIVGLKECSLPLGHCEHQEGGAA